MWIKKSIKTCFYNFFFSIYIKMVSKYQKHKEKLQKEACEGYQNLSEEEKQYEKRLKTDIKIIQKK